MGIILPPPNTRKVFSGVEFYEDTQSKKANQPYLYDTVWQELLYLQTLPNELNINSDPNFSVIESPSRNVPLYHYTGSEQSIQFQISFFANHESREDVIRKCTWINALSKNDGYDESIHPILFAWGDLFLDTQWIVTNAPYKLGLFDREFKMLPRYAQIDITLKRISKHNPKRADLLFKPTLFDTPQISII